MRHPSVVAYNEYVGKLDYILKGTPLDIAAVENLYVKVKEHKEYALLMLRCAEILAESALQSRQHDAGIILVSDALESFENVNEHYGSHEQKHHILHNLIAIKIRILACYKSKECDDAILAITEATLKQFPGIWTENQSMHGIFYATQRAHALNRQKCHSDAANLYLTMQELGKNIKEPMLESISALGWAYSIIMGGKVLAHENKWQEAVTAWLSAASVIDHWKSALSPDEEYETDYLVSHFWNSAYARWLANKGGDFDELKALYEKRNSNERKSFKSDILMHQLPFEDDLLKSIA